MKAKVPWRVVVGDYCVDTLVGVMGCGGAVRPHVRPDQKRFGKSRRLFRTHLL